MSAVEQLTIDFDAPPDPEWELQQRWAENEQREREHWTDEALCIVWAYGYEDRAWWESLPSYQRHAWLNRYLCYREDAQQRGVRMPSAGYVLALEEEHYRNSKRLAESWAADIRKAFLERQPCPIKPEPEYQSVLEWALQLAQVPRECLAVGQTEGEVAA